MFLTCIDPAAPASRAVQAALALGILALSTPASAASLGVEASTDLRRRGISWSDGKPAIEAWGSLPLVAGFSIEGAAATLRNSRRHGGADFLGEAALRYTRQSGASALWVDAAGLGFAGASGQNYTALRGGASQGIGPVQFTALVDWAPSQRAIGGSNLAFGASVGVGIPATPLSLRAAVAYSTGSDDGSGRARRLRPGGDYGDLRLDADYVLGPITLGASFTTTIDANRVPGTAGDYGSRLIARAAFAF